ncbi:EamA family transporter, partial [Kitasatospora sp. NPDC059747]|uniref:EamA family transporter n=1 Tax=Kitasatospora sp. NPDC059747 TaxID=3346930 RepID=UPI0036622E4B
MTSHAAVPFRHGLLSISAAAVAWGVGGAVAALLLRTSGLGPVAVSFWRFAVAALCLAVLPRRERRRTPRRAAVLTGIGLAVSQCAYFGSVRFAGLGLATLITIGAGPVLTSLGAHVLLGERLTRRGAGARAGGGAAGAAPGGAQARGPPAARGGTR